MAPWTSGNISVTFKLMSIWSRTMPTAWRSRWRVYNNDDSFFTSFDSLKLSVEWGSQPEERPEHTTRQRSEAHPPLGACAGQRSLSDAGPEAEYGTPPLPVS